MFFLILNALPILRLRVSGDLNTILHQVPGVRCVINSVGRKGRQNEEYDQQAVLL